MHLFDENSNEPLNKTSEDDIYQTRDKAPSESDTDEDITEDEDTTDDENTIDEEDGEVGFNGSHWYQFFKVYVKCVSPLPIVELHNNREVLSQIYLD